MENNPYQAPTAPVAEVLDDQVASRMDRFLGALVDTIIMMVILVPIMFMTGYWTMAANGEAGIGTTIAYGVVGFVVFMLVQGYPLSKSAQTWGKKAVGIRIAMMDGSQPSLGTLLFKRYLPVNVAGALPIVGPMLGLVDSLLIFRSDRRCGHDLIAGTQVLKN
jgi:uncharacterized RDD family membrane protein YckC